MSSSHIVQPDKIQAELNNLWSILENKNKVRASLFNLIFYSKKSLRDEYIRKIAQKIIEKFPARIFFISSDVDSKEDKLTTSVSIMSAEHGEFDITCDFIEIATTSASEHQVPFIIMPHIMADLPIFLLWAEDPSLPSLLREELEKIATRLIFDSETAKDLNEFAKAILAIRARSHCEIADLNWARLESWRDLITTVFREESQWKKLKKVRTIHLSYNAQETLFFCHTRIQSIYLQAWLASRLHWTLCSSSHDTEKALFSYQNSEQQPITVFIEPQRHLTLPPGLVVTLDFSNEDKESFHFERNLSALNEISCSYSSSVQCALPTKFLIAKGESGQSLVKEICNKGTSQHYLEILTLLSQMKERGLC